MSVIRSGTRPQPPLFLSIKDAEQEARQIIAAAWEQSAAQSKSARAEAFEQGRNDGYQAGLAEGRRAGEAQALEEMRESLKLAADALAEAVGQFSAASQSFQEQAVRDCADLSLRVAERIIKRCVQLDPHVLAANLEEALKLVVGAQSMRITFHPDDRAAMEAAIARLRLTSSPLNAARLVEDDTLARGGCRIYTENATIDADLDAQLRRLIDHVLPDPRERDGEAA